MASRNKAKHGRGASGAPSLGRGKRKAGQSAAHHSSMHTEKSRLGSAARPKGQPSRRRVEEEPSPGAGEEPEVEEGNYDELMRQLRELIAGQAERDRRIAALEQQNAEAVRNQGVVAVHHVRLQHLRHELVRSGCSTRCLCSLEKHLPCQLDGSVHRQQSLLW